MTLFLKEKKSGFYVQVYVKYGHPEFALTHWFNDTSYYIKVGFVILIASAVFLHRARPRLVLAMMLLSVAGNAFAYSQKLRLMDISVPDDLLALKDAAYLDRAAATGFSSIFYHDPAEGLSRDLAVYEQLSDWLSFYTVVNPEFPAPEKHVALAADNGRVVGIRLFPSLHHYDLSGRRTVNTLRAAAEVGLPVAITARLFDGRVAPPAIRQAEPDREALCKLLAAVPEATVILSMFFFAELTALAIDWETRPNVFIDVGCSKPSVSSFDTLPSWFPPERVILGTGAPFYYWKGSRLALEGARLPASAKQAISGNTAKEVLRWG